MSELVVEKEERASPAFWVVAIFLTLLVFIHHDLHNVFKEFSLSVGRDVILGRDFANVFTAGRLLIEDKLAIIYDIESYRAYQTGLFEGAIREHNYSYSPVSFLYVWLFGLIPYILSYILWTGATGAAFIWAARPYMKTAGLPAWVTLLLPASIINIWAGHYGFLFGALWLGAWRMLDSRPRTAGMLVGFMIVKPHLAILMPFVLARRRAWIPFVYAGLTVAAAIAISIVCFGIEPWVIYVTRTSSFQASLVDDIKAFFVTMMPTVAPILFLMELPAPLIWTIQAIVSAGAFAAILRFLPKDTERAGFATACATFLVLPYAFIYDMTIMNVAAALMLTQMHQDDRPWQRAAGYLGFVLPLITIFLGRCDIPLAPIIIAMQFVALLVKTAPFTLPHAVPAVAGAGR
ncbi:DUF2029 domain-containing protein [Allosphingosinicella flava]|uniref:DUF2029 domain-containing protein n=1 Tax=Allosphingosinicella flava TaxID=2771430 RepID=A0A7T2GJG0_9SPHN|nr:glycosyltransferase family 87 protein [Sphingosinicella flava]QPQ54633.1 DUF2029 domain-containing protein [Sphingosinicella flava]